MDNDTLKNILEHHKQWLNDHATGERADLYGADLYIGNIRVTPVIEVTK